MCAVVLALSEIGAMASAVEVFEENAIARLSLEAETRALQERSAEEKRLAMADLAGAFEKKVGGLVRNLTSAATELEATARSMSSVAEETNAQSSAVATASQQTSVEKRAGRAKRRGQGDGGELQGLCRRRGLNSLHIRISTDLLDLLIGHADHVSQLGLGQLGALPGGAEQQPDFSIILCWTTRHDDFLVKSLAFAR